MNELQQLMGCTYPWASNRAAQAIQIQEALNAKQITNEQAVELLKDLINTDELNKQANDFTVKTTLVNAINNLITIAEGLTSI